MNANNANKRGCFVCAPAAHYTLLSFFFNGHECTIFACTSMRRINYLRVLAFIWVNVTAAVKHLPRGKTAAFWRSVPLTQPTKS